jgi:hypothetical protein
MVRRHVVYGVCIAEATLLAAILVALVIQPDVFGFVPSSRIRQLCGWGAVALMAGCGYAAVGWVRSMLTWARVRRSLVSASMARRPVYLIAGHGGRDADGHPTLARVVSRALDHDELQSARPTAAGSWWSGPAWLVTGRMSGPLHHRHRFGRVLLVAVPAIIVASACGYLPSVPNPFAPSATPRPSLETVAQATPTTRPVPTPVPDPTPEPFQPFWVRNHRITELWSGRSSGPDTVSCGATSEQFCSFLVVLPPEGERLYVFNPYSQDYLWFDAADVGPAGPPDERPIPRPTDVNCTQDLYTG